MFIHGVSKGKVSFFYMTKYTFIYIYVCVCVYVCVRHMASQAVLMVQNLPANTGDVKGVGSIPGLERSLGIRNGNPIPAFLPGKFHGQKSLVDYSPWDCKELD